ncbi:MAG: adenylate kinase [Thermodesulfobacteriota bacterium]|jgi:adenylate kinase|nr:MAG: adenylate kinase [Thermodesulfobacteriota bacterium]
MKVILLGAPGAGKGTVAKLLTDYDGSVQISTGDILRVAVKAGTPVGKQAKAYMDAGGLVPDSIIMQIMEARLQEPDCAKGFILDGFPRTIPQSEELKALLGKLAIKLDMVANLVVPREVILDRLTTRRTCSNSSCQEIYNVKTNPPNADGTCKKCGKPTIQRDDETEEAILNRLEVYTEKTAPLIDFYRKEGMVKDVTSLDLKEIVEDITKALEK